MVESRRWTVEAKDFEVMIKGGLSGVRIVEKRNGKQMSVFVHRDELSWLIGALEVVVDVDTSEIFWDQARAGYPRLITQKCSNRHGRFLTIEECEGRKRSGTVLVPEGRQRQGWVTLIAELRRASSSLRVGRDRRVMLMSKVASAGRSYAEVAGHSKAVNILPTSASNGSEKIPAEAPSSLGLSHAPLELGGCIQKTNPAPGVSFGSVEAKADHRNPGMPAAKQSSEDLACPGFQGKLKGREELALNVLQELGWLRDWLRRVRGEVDAGLLRVDAVFKALEMDGPGQESKAKSWLPKPRRKNKSKAKKALNHKVDVGLGSGSMVVKSIMKPISYMTNGAEPSMSMGLEDSQRMKPITHTVAGAGMNKGLGLVDRPVISPDASGGPCGEKHGADEDRGLVGGPIAGSVSSGPSDECVGLSGAGETMFGDELSPEVETGDGKGERRRNKHGCDQKKPTGCSDKVEGNRELEAVPTRGKLNRPTCSWVAGRTGFGPVGTGSDMGLITPTTEMVREAEVYTAEGDLVLGCTTPSSGLMNGISSEGGLEENPVDSSRGVDKEDSTIIRKLNRAGEVSNCAGLSCDGQEGRKMDCLKRIIVEKSGSGGGGGSVNSNAQQVEESIIGEWGTSSDYEA
jgi:hypothetical protein